MILQRIVFPKSNRVETDELYFHSNGTFKNENGKMHVPEGTVILFDTYFNAFSAKKWAKYTTVKQLVFHIKIDGAGTVSLMGADKKEIQTKEFFSDSEILFYLEIPSDEECIYLRIEAKKESYLKKAWIETLEKASDVRLALATCTYNRKEALMKNLKVIRQENKVLFDGNPILDWIYVIDNARNLKKEEIEDSFIKLFPNPNTGGAGGFTRGLKEALERTTATHIILMDDDVTIEFESFVRNKAFLSYLRDEYQENFIGGAMFRMNTPYIMHAAGENWDNGRIRNPYKDTDMRTLEQVIKTSQEIDPEQAYAAWWYCCIPRSHVEQKGLPMQLFLHGDDVEYGLRNGKPPIYINGVSVWHEEFEDKRASILVYYEVRNWLIVNAVYMKKHSREKALKIIFKNFYGCIMRYRYQDVDLIVRGVEDFLKGPEWLQNVDAEALHQELSAYGYQMRAVEHLPETVEHYTKNKLYLMLRYFLPAKGSVVLRMGAPIGAFAGKKKVLLVEPKVKKGFETEKRISKTMLCGKLLIYKCSRLHRAYRKEEMKWKRAKMVKHYT